MQLLRRHQDLDSPIEIVECYFIIGLQDRYGIGDCSGAAQFTMDEVWL